MDTIVDSANFINSLESAPDKLRGELGTYYGNDSAGRFAAVNRASGKFQNNFHITPVQENTNVVVPIKQQRIYFYGNEQSFRDHVQWREYVESVVSVETPYFDHTYTSFNFSVTKTFKNNYFDPQYEDATKVNNTNLLLNYNLLNYPYNNRAIQPSAEYVRDIAVVRTRFDSVDYEVKDDRSVFKLISEYSDRVSNYTGSVTSAVERQRNIFMLSNVANGISTEESRNREGEVNKTAPFPFQYEQFINAGTFSTIDDISLASKLKNNKVDKFIHQAIKNNLAFRNVNFRTPINNNTQVKIHDLISIMVDTDLANFNLNFDELFLLNGDELTYDTPVDRFVNGVRAINAVADIRRFFIDNSRDIEQIYNSEISTRQIIGYKIEKYIDNDVTLPTQTYYFNKFNNLTFIDTQLKYGRKYIYKTFALVAVVGSSYQYTRLHVSQGDNSMVNTADNSVNEEHEVDTNKKYAAFVDVEVRPSFQVLEVPISNFQEMFYDQPPMPPQIHFYNQKGRNTLEAILSPNLNSSYDPTYTFRELTPDDTKQAERLELSADNVYGTVFSSDYFTGRYEVYRMDDPPQRITDFANNFLTEVDMNTTVTFFSQNSNGGKNKVGQSIQNNQVAHFEDDLVPNRKYYYLFRALTYHGTPSNYTPIYEVEFIQDSDETKINVSEYVIPENVHHVYRRMSKRIIKISPNFEHLLFTGDETNVQDALQNIGVLDTKLLSLTKDGELFKIRITSKHTGKKMDINLRVKLKDDINT